MSTQTTDLTGWLDSLEEARKAATPGPWFAWDRGVGWMIALDPGGDRVLPEGMRTDLARQEDAALIVAAVNALPELVAALRGVLALADESTFDVREWGEPGSPYSNGARHAFDRIRAVVAAAHTEERR
jgi:hypothetical protein